MSYIVRSNILICIYHSIFSVFFLVIINNFLFIYLYKWFLIYLIRCLDTFFNLHLEFIYLKKKHIIKTYISNISPMN
jgi:hypothetical protein